jgi:quercetin dioxygenase-like cupin family protein
MSKILLSRAVFLVAIILAGVGASVSQQTGQLQRIPQFENEDVNVWKTVVPPNAPLVMHTHEHPRVIVALSGGTMKTVYENGPTETHLWEAGKAYWLSLEEGLKRHADSNTGDRPIEVMVIELKKDK